MKNIILSIATIMITTGAYAQSESTSRLENQSQKQYYSQIENRNPPDGFMLQNGNLVMVKNGKTTRVENDTTLSNGTVVMSDGYYMNKGESKAIFKEGDHMDMDGTFTSADNSKNMDGSDKKSHPNGYIFQDGKVMKVKNGSMSPLDVDIKLINGTAVMKNGYYMKEGEPKMKFKEGEHIGMSGELTQTHKNIDEYHKMNQHNQKHPMSDSTKNKDY